MTINNIKPVRHTTAISILLKDWDAFKKVFWCDKVYKYQDDQKTISGEKVNFEIRSMRVNEFCDILDKNKIKWKLLDEDIRIQLS